MRQVFSFAIALTLALVFTGPAPASTRALDDTLSLTAFIDRVTALERQVAALDLHRPEVAGAIARALPASWTIAADGRTFIVDAEWLAVALRAWRVEATLDGRSRIAAQLALLRDQAAAFSARAPAGPAARQKLDAILARGEFTAVHGPTAWDRLRQRVITWLVNLVDRFLGSAAASVVTDAVAYLVIALGAGALIVIVVRLLRRAARLDRLDLPAPPPVRSWTAWLDDAQRAAGDEHWADAVRLAYWTGIVFLEGRGLWRTDPSRTPREYLRLMPPERAELPALRGATSLLERVWYGRRPAGRAEFDAAIDYLRQLGCSAR